MSSPKSILLPHRLAGLSFASTPSPHLLDQPRQEEEVRKAYRKGYEDASTHFNAMIVEQRASLDHLGREVLGNLREAHATLVEEIRTLLPELVGEGVRRVLSGTEAEAGLLVRLVTELLNESGLADESLEVLLHPEDLKELEEFKMDWSKTFSGFSFRSDSRLQRGDCLLNSRFGRLDGRLSTKLEKLVVSLKGGFQT